jgi:hypothetical protein
MSAALDTEQCAECPLVTRCSKWNKNGKVDYLKLGCRPVKTNLRPRITEEPIPSRINRIPLRPVAPVLDAEESQRNRFKLRDLK